MALNCKQGELAVIVKSFAPSNIGKIVRCMEFCADGVALAHWKKTGPVWRIDQDTVWASQKGDQLRLPYASDTCLRPLRDSDGQDETLQWAGLPQPVQQPVPE